MKKIFMPLAAVAILLAGCDKVENLNNLADISKDVDYEQSITIDGLPDGSITLPPGGISQDMPAIAVETKSKQFIEENNTSAEYLKHIKPKAFNASVMNPANGNFDFMDSIRIYISAPGMSEVLAAYKYGIPKGQTNVALDVVDADLKDYILKDSVFFRVGAHFVAIPDSGTQLHFKSTFNFLANPLNKK